MPSSAQELRGVRAGHWSPVGRSVRWMEGRCICRISAIDSVIEEERKRGSSSHSPDYSLSRSSLLLIVGHSLQDASFSLFPLSNLPAMMKKVQYKLLDINRRTKWSFFIVLEVAEVIRQITCVSETMTTYDSSLSSVPSSILALISRIPREFPYPLSDSYFPDGARERRNLSLAVIAPGRSY